MKWLSDIIIGGRWYGAIFSEERITESYEALAEYIRRDFDGLKESVTLLMSGGHVKINTSS